MDKEIQKVKGNTADKIAIRQLYSDLKFLQKDHLKLLALYEDTINEFDRVNSYKRNGRIDMTRMFLSKAVKCIHETVFATHIMSRDTAFWYMDYFNMKENDDGVTKA